MGSEAHTPPDKRSAVWPWLQSALRMTAIELKLLLRARVGVPITLFSLAAGIMLDARRQIRHLKAERARSRTDAE